MTTSTNESTVALPEELESHLHEIEAKLQQLEEKLALEASRPRA